MFLIYLGIGAIAGIFSGLLGIGGGLIIVPGLLFVFTQQHISTYLMHLATGTSLACTSVTTFASMYAHHGHGAVIWPIFFLLAPGLVLGGFGGALLAGLLPDDVLRFLFSIFVFLVSAQIGIGVFKPTPNHQLPGILAASIAGLIIGVISALLGIGGGSMIVPYLIWHNVPIRRAVATSAACGLPPALASAVGYLMSGWNVVGLPLYSTGFIYWPAVMGIIVTSTVFARLGAKLAHKIPVHFLRRIFALFLFFIGIHLMFNNK